MGAGTSGIETMARLLARLWVPVGVPATVGVPVAAPAPQALSDRYLFGAGAG